MIKCQNMWQERIGEADQAWERWANVGVVSGIVRRTLWRTGFNLDIVTCLDIGWMEGMAELQTEEEKE